MTRSNPGAISVGRSSTGEHMTRTVLIVIGVGCLIAESGIALQLSCGILTGLGIAFISYSIALALLAAIIHVPIDETPLVRLDAEPVRA